MMRLEASHPFALQFAAGADTGGCLIRSAQAFDAEHRANATPWTVRSMITAKNYIDYPEDLPFSPKAFARLYDEADVMILNSILYAHHVYDGGKGKPTIVVHHGVHKDHFSRTLEEIIAESHEIGAVQCGTTVNLELFGPITWVPTPVDVGFLARERERRFLRAETGPLRVLHCPTDRSIKSTADLIAAVNVLRLEGVPIELTVLERLSNREIIRAKASFADVYVDQLKLGYGVNAIEAWAMGIPVIAGFADHPDWRTHALKRYGCGSPTGLPFYEASPEMLVATLRMFVESVEARVMWGAIGKVHAARWHSQETHVRLMSALLQEARYRPTRPGPLRTNLRTLEERFQAAERARKAGVVFPRPR